MMDIRGAELSKVALPLSVIACSLRPSAPRAPVGVCYAPASVRGDLIPLSSAPTRRLAGQAVGVAGAASAPGPGAAGRSRTTPGEVSARSSDATQRLRQPGVRPAEPLLQVPQPPRFPQAQEFGFIVTRIQGFLFGS